MGGGMTALAKLTAWVLMAINAWGAAPIPPSQVQRVAEVREHVADSLIAVAYDVDEPPIHPGPWGRAKTVVLFTSIFALETGFVERNIVGHCIKPACDNGTSWGLAQMKVPPYGFRLVGTGFAYCFKRSADCWSVPELLDDWTLQVRSAFHMYRTLGPQQWTTYPRAVAQAKEWLAKNPPPAEDSEAMRTQIAAE